jgi:hypothetical protein
MDPTAEKAMSGQEPPRAQHAEGAHRYGGDGGRKEPAVGPRRRRDSRAERHGVDPQDRVGADLRHDREKGRDGRRRVGVGGGQPELHREERRLHREDDHEEDRRHADERRLLRRQLGVLHGKVRDVERAGRAVERAEREEEERGAREVHHDILEPRPHPLAPTRMDHQAVGGDKQHLEEDEEVEDVARQERAVDPHELELEQGVEVPAPRVPAGRDRVDQHDQREKRRQKHHQRRQPVEHEHDPEGRGPVAEAVEMRLPARGHDRQPDGDGEKRNCPGERRRPRERHVVAHDEGEERGEERGQDDRRDDPVAHGAGSSPRASSSAPSMSIRSLPDSR